MAEYIPLQHPWVWAFAACVVAVALEGALSGTKVKARFAELRQPQRSLPLWAWFIIGFVYYVLFFLTLNSLLGSLPAPGWTPAALALVAVLLGANAAWNWVFFRKRDLWFSVVLSALYILVAIALAIALFRLRNPLAGWYLIFVGYLTYSMWWVYSVWRLNTASGAYSKTDSQTK
ncbi:MAG: tryptophan-rich sensory protein [Blastocatellia bacterium]